MVALRPTQPLRELAPLLEPELRKSHIELKEEFLADPLIHADPAQLKQVLINLVKNAADAIGADGTITLRSRSDTLETVMNKGADSTSSLPSAGGRPASLESLMEDLLQQAKGGADIDVHARVFEAMEKELFQRAIQLAQGNQAKAARWLKISRQTMREKL